MFVDEHGSTECGGITIQGSIKLIHFK